MPNRWMLVEPHYRLVFFELAATVNAQPLMYDCFVEDLLMIVCRYLTKNWNCFLIRLDLHIVICVPEHLKKLWRSNPITECSLLLLENFRIGFLMDCGLLILR